MEKETVCILIGNTDNNLTQQEWASFVRSVSDEVHCYFDVVYFRGSPPSESVFQNHCFVGEMADGGSDKQFFMGHLKRLKEQFRQDSIAVVFGKTEMV